MAGLIGNPQRGFLSHSFLSHGGRGDRNWPTQVKEIAAKEGAAGLQEIPGVGKL